MVTDFFCRFSPYICSVITTGYMRYFYCLLLLLCFCVPAPQAGARMLYGYNIPEQALESRTIERVKQDMARHPLLKPKERIDARIKLRPFRDRSSDFLMILTLIAFIGIFRLANPSYLRNLFRAFRNPTLSTRQLKEQLRQDSAASLTMDLIFCVSMGLYLYFTLNHIHNKNIILEYPVIVILLGFILLFVVIYVVRFLFLKFTGWVFNISEITDNYTFNVFLINKILGLALIPFTIILAFGQGQWVQASLFLSFLVIAILFLNRYLRSGVVFGYFIKFSKFHFFMYLCASELLPLAVLMKLVNQWLIS
ncbi:DUF4271 domain-containing protein [Taibaiella koreensis]|uniref:DUF4271 domain-containing protein n=1 Tax=Taibaiella koreensis TaxID=1268548 RepID=UPI000E59F105|nr:DUF4271 domain-containing protein [Taibaiella koreensis]